MDQLAILPAPAAWANVQEDEAPPSLDAQLSPEEQQRKTAEQKRKKAEEAALDRLRSDAWDQWRSNAVGADRIVAYVGEMPSIVYGPTPARPFTPEFLMGVNAATESTLEGGAIAQDLGENDPYVVILVWSHLLDSIADLSILYDAKAALQPDDHTWVKTAPKQPRILGSGLAATQKEAADYLRTMASRARKNMDKIPPPNYALITRYSDGNAKKLPVDPMMAWFFSTDDFLQGLASTLEYIHMSWTSVVCGPVLTNTGSQLDVELRNDDRWNVGPPFEVQKGWFNPLATPEQCRALFSGYGMELLEGGYMTLMQATNAIQRYYFSITDHKDYRQLLFYRASKMLVEGISRLTKKVDSGDIARVFGEHPNWRVPRLFFSRPIMNKHAVVSHVVYQNYTVPMALIELAQVAAVVDPPLPKTEPPTEQIPSPTALAVFEYAERLNEQLRAVDGNSAETIKYLSFSVGWLAEIKAAGVARLTDPAAVTSFFALHQDLIDITRLAPLLEPPHRG